MDNKIYMTISARIMVRIKHVVVLTLVIIAGILVSLTVNGQNGSDTRYYQKVRHKHYRDMYRQQSKTYLKSCDLLEKKKYAKPKAKTSIAKRKPVYKPMAEVETITAMVTKPRKEQKAEKVSVEPQPVTVLTKLEEEEIKAKIETVSAQKLVELHDKEDDVLAENNLPAPSSQKHEEVRKKVSDKIKNKETVYPLDLQPLYFTFDKDEFSIVNLDPFLYAVEFALQGRVILIEGHTDSFGNDQYNVQLSIKRVQRIREMMQEMGVPDDRISIVGYGEEISQHNNNSDQGRQLNRRVDFKVF